MNQNHPQEKNLIPLGRIQAPWGLKGGVKFRLYNLSSNTLQKARLVYLKTGLLFRKVRLLSVRPHGKSLLLHLEGFHNPEQASDLRGQEIFVEARWLPQKDPQEYYVHELTGLQVFTTEQEYLGQVEEVVCYGASDILVVRENQDPKTEKLIPYLDTFVKEVSLPNKKIILSPYAIFLTHLSGGYVG